MTENNSKPKPRKAGILAAVAAPLFRLTRWHRKLPTAWKPVALSLGLLLLMGGWFLTGILIPSAPDSPHAKAPEARPAMKVEVRESTAKQVAREALVEGEVVPNRLVTLRAETAGAVREIIAAQGAMLKEGDIILRLDVGAREAELAEARAVLDQRQKKYQATAVLRSKGFQTRDALKEAKSALEAARAALQRVERQLGDTIIRAPFDGIFEERLVNVGDYLAIGQDIAKLIDNSPLKVSGSIPQNLIGKVKAGDPVAVRFATGETAEASLIYVSVSGDTETRTFRVEAEIPNANSELPSGVSAELRIRYENVGAHFMSPALLSLDTEGQLGIKTVDDANVVEFKPVEIVSSGTNGIWLAGLPSGIRVITQGHGFVEPGQTVVPVDASKPAAIARRRNGTGAKE